MSSGALGTFLFSLGLLQVIRLIKMTPLMASKFQNILGTAWLSGSCQGLLLKSHFAVPREPLQLSWVDSIKIGVIG